MKLINFNSEWDYGNHYRLEILKFKNLTVLDFDVSFYGDYYSSLKDTRINISLGRYELISFTLDMLNFSINFAVLNHHYEYEDD